MGTRTLLAATLTAAMLVIAGRADAQQPPP